MIEWAMQVNNAGVGGVAVDQDGLRALNIDPQMWVCRLGNDYHMIVHKKGGLETTITRRLLNFQIEIKTFDVTLSDFQL